MSRSFKKKPFACVYYHYTSNKWSKKHANRIFRKQNKIRLKTQRNLLYRVREIADNYDFLSDGPLIYIHKKWYNYLLETGSTQEECNELYNKIFRK